MCRSLATLLSANSKNPKFCTKVNKSLDMLLKKNFKFKGQNQPDKDGRLHHRPISITPIIWQHTKLSLYSFAAQAQMSKMLLV